jgi:methyltransferase (TIGR00027 family)
MRVRRSGAARSPTTATVPVSFTAKVCASARAGHLLAHGSSAVLQDWLAWPLLGDDAARLASRLTTRFAHNYDRLATWVAARSRYAEDWMTESGAEQYVILGSGLDTFAWRAPGGVRVFEVDHPATLAFKRRRLRALGVPDLDDVVWVPADLETEPVGDVLARAGLTSAPTFVNWLGVTSYLSKRATETTLRSLPPGFVAVTHAAPAGQSGPSSAGASLAFKELAGEGHESPTTAFTSGEFADLLAACRMTARASAGCEDVVSRYGLPAMSWGNERIVLAERFGRE